MQSLLSIAFIPTTAPVGPDLAGAAAENPRGWLPAVMPAVGRPLRAMPIHTLPVGEARARAPGSAKTWSKVRCRPAPATDPPDGPEPQGENPTNDAAPAPATHREER